MKANLAKRILSMVLALVFLLSMVACQKTEYGEFETDSYLETGDEVTEETNSDDSKNSSESESVSSKEETNKNESDNKDSSKENASSENKDSGNKDSSKDNGASKEQNSENKNSDKESNNNDKNDVTSNNNNTSSQQNNAASEKEETTDNNSQAQNSSEANSSETNSKVENTAPSGETSLSRDEFIAKMPANLKGKTLTYMYWWDAKKQMDGEAIAKFEKATGVTVKTEVASYTDFQTQLTAKIAAQKSPDLVRLIGNQTWQITALQPITNSGYDFKDKAWDQELLKDFTFNGSIYAANLKDSAISDVAVIYYNVKALEDADMEDPYDLWKKGKWTWDKFWDMCDEFVAANRNKSGYAGATFEYGDAYVRSLGGSCYYYDGNKSKVVNNMSNSATEQGWKTTLDAIDKGWLLANHDETKFDQGKVLFFWSGPFSARRLDDRQKALKERNRLGVVPLPTDSKYQVMYEYTAFGIPQGSKNAAVVPYYLRYVLDKSSYDMNKVYYNDKSREVIDYACSLTNRFYGNGTVTGFTAKLYESGANQVKSVINSYKDSAQDFVNGENDRIKLFSK